jgi:hypothetical protein
VNHALSGDMVETKRAGAEGIESFGFSSGGNRSLVLLNLNLVGSVEVNFRGPSTPHGKVEIARLHAPSIDSNNEDGENVAITRWTEASFRLHETVRLPPYSITVLSWKH